ncbi:MAG: hypothetical protein ACXWJD_11830, partial [Burkholderiaceae bacterium]
GGAGNDALSVASPEADNASFSKDSGDSGVIWFVTLQFFRRGGRQVVRYTKHSGQMKLAAAALARATRQF